MTESLEQFRLPNFLGELSFDYSLVKVHSGEGLDEVGFPPKHWEIT